MALPKRFAAVAGGRGGYLARIRHKCRNEKVCGAPLKLFSQSREEAGKRRRRNGG
jgi:hypothetical protein